MEMLSVKKPTDVHGKEAQSLDDLLHDSPSPSPTPTSKQKGWGSKRKKSTSLDTDVFVGKCLVHCFVTESSCTLEKL